MVGHNKLNMLGQTPGQVGKCSMFNHYFKYWGQAVIGRDPF